MNSSKIKVRETKKIKQGFKMLYLNYPKIRFSLATDFQYF